MCELCNMSYRVGKACQLCLLNQHQHPWCWFQVRINRIRPTSYVGGLAERGGEGWWSHMRSWNRAWMRYISADIIFYKLAKHMKQIFPFQNVHSFITIPTLQSKVTQLCDWNKIVHKMMHRILLNLCVCVCVCVCFWKQVTMMTMFGSKTWSSNILPDILCSQAKCHKSQSSCENPCPCLRTHFCSSVLSKSNNTLGQNNQKTSLTVS
jgi:hypothetical protein